MPQAKHPGIVARAWRALTTPIKAPKFVWPMFGFSGFGGDINGSWLRRSLPGTAYDFETNAGRLWKNSVVAICIKWIARVFPESRFVVYKQNDEDNAEAECEIVKKHPLAELIRRPNPYYGGAVLWAATVLSYIVSGNSYWFIVRSAAGKPVYLFWVPHWMMRPMWDSDGSTFITKYRYHVNGQYFEYSDSDVIHFRDGIDPDDQRVGLSTLAAELRNICLGNELETYEAAIVRNMGVPGIVIKPPPPLPNATTRPTIGKVAADTIRVMWREKFAMDKAGEPLVMAEPYEIMPQGFSPKDLSAVQMAKLPETRICAAIGIPAVTVGLLAGLEEASAKSSHANSETQAYRGCIIPTQRTFAEVVEDKLLWELGDPATEFCGFDNSHVSALQDDKDAVAKRAYDGYRADVLKRSEARKLVGEKPGADDEVYMSDVAGANKAAVGQVDPNAAEDDAKPKKKPATSDEEDEEERALQLRSAGTWITVNGHAVLIEDKESSGGHSGTVAEKSPSPSAKSIMAKQTAVYVGADIQRYSEEHNEPVLASAVKGVSLRDNEPVDVIVIRKGKLTHGVELKTMTNNQHGRIYMNGPAKARKSAWMKEHGADYHTVVFDDHQVYDASGKGEHDDSKREIYYKRGFGSFRVSAMHKVENIGELTTLMDTPTEDLPAGAKPMAGYKAAA